MAATLARSIVGIAVASTMALGTARAADGMFDLDKDLALFFKVQAEIQATDPGRHDTSEEAAAKAARRAEMFRKHRIRDEKHWKKESQTGMEYAYSKRAHRIYGGEEAVKDMRRAAGQGMTLEEYRAHEKKMRQVTDDAQAQLELLHDESKFDAALLAPIDGVSLEKYAATAAAAMFHEDNYTLVTRDTGITEKQFEALGEKWTERMRADPTRLVMKKYGGHLFAAARGRYAAAGKDLGRAILENAPLAGPEPIPMEKWTEITEYYGSRPPAEVDTTAGITKVLQPYGLTFYEWNIISNWWGHKRTQAMKSNDGAFMSRWMALRQKYHQQFSTRK